MTTGNELKELRKEEFAAFKIVTRNEKKLREIENNLETRNLDLLQAQIDLERLQIEQQCKYSDDPIRTTASWEKYLRTKKGLQERIEQLKLAIKEETGLKKGCLKNADKAKKSSLSQEAGAYVLESRDHQDAITRIKIEISDYQGEIRAALAEAKKDPEYVELKIKIRLAKNHCESLEKEISDLQKELEAQKKVLKKAEKDHKALKSKIEKIQKQIYSGK